MAEQRQILLLCHVKLILFIESELLIGSHPVHPLRNYLTVLQEGPYCGSQSFQLLQGTHHYNILLLRIFLVLHHLLLLVLVFD